MQQAEFEGGLEEFEMQRQLLAELVAAPTLETIANRGDRHPAQGPESPQSIRT